MTSPYEAEVRLIRWGDSSAAGRTITLELPYDAGEGHPFKGLPTGHKHGQRMRMTFSMIDDDETVSPDPPRRRERYAKVDDMGKAVQRAALLAKDLAFQQWASEKSGLPPSESVAACLIRAECGVASRGELAFDERAYQAFRALETEFDLYRGAMPEVRG